MFRKPFNGMPGRVPRKEHGRAQQSLEKIVVQAAKTGLADGVYAHADAGSGKTFLGLTPQNGRLPALKNTMNTWLAVNVPSLRFTEGLHPKTKAPTLVLSGSTANFQSHLGETAEFLNRVFARNASRRW